ncbi:serine hydrolase [Paraburkholderia sp. 5N]|uniref:Serine hydrolase n=2 Tax=Paraburkholderia elongata TaxID=2675747 RepID=A0A972NT57_9BURK|nr:serine hydrolase [Paraburkholderia elongata]
MDNIRATYQTEVTVRSSNEMQADDVVLYGYCAPKYERLREAFARNFREMGEVGAGYTVIADGALVANLWGGWKDAARQAPWSADTVACVWSVSKAVAGVCFAILVDRGLISYGDKVSTYWPEFAAEGKGDVTVAMLLAHQSGITGFDTPATLEDLFAGEPAACRLAAQKPFWNPGERAGYSNVVGILADALFRRVEGRSIKQFVADELKAKLGLEISVGLPHADRSRAADLIESKKLDVTKTVKVTSEAQRALINPVVDVPLQATPEFQASEFFAANCFANARSLASMCALLLDAGHDGPRLVKPDVIAEATKLRFDGIDEVRQMRRSWSAGFLTNHVGDFGPNTAAFGHGGWGGAFCYADPVAGVAVGYVMNHMSDQMERNPRRINLVKAVYDI